MAVAAKKRSAQSVEGAEWASGYKLASHIGLTRGAVDQMMAQGILTRGPEGLFNLTANRLAYIAHLRKNRKSSEHQAAQIAYAKQKTEWLRQRVQRNAGETISVQKHNELTETAIGLVLQEFSGLAAAIGGQDFTLRKRVDAAVIAARRRLSENLTRLVDARGEPPLSEQG